MSAQFQDYYKTLDVSRGATPADIKKAFRTLARLYHPDTAKDKETAEEKFKQINEAYEVLKDPEKRKQYDSLGQNWNNPGAAQSQHRQASPSGEDHQFTGTGFSDFFEQYFSSANRYGESPPHDYHSQTANPRPRRGQDIEGDILVTLEESMNGAVRDISLKSLNRQTGKAETSTFQVRIPLGVQDGQRIRIPNHGSRGIAGGPDGDLYLRVRHAAHPDFTSEKADLHHELPIAPWEAVLGSERNVPTLTGYVKIRIPATAENGQQLRVREKGLPKGKSGTHGDLYITLNIEIPTDLTEQQRNLWEQLRETSTPSTK